MNLPGGHQHSLMPATCRSSPGFEPSKAQEIADSLGTPSRTVWARWQPSPPTASKNSAPTRRAKDMPISFDETADSPAAAVGLRSTIARLRLLRSKLLQFLGGLAIIGLQEQHILELIGRVLRGANALIHFAPSGEQGDAVHA